MTKRSFFSKMAEAGAKHASGSRHLRRKAEAEAKKSIPAMKKIIRRNKQRQDHE